MGQKQTLLGIKDVHSSARAAGLVYTTDRYQLDDEHGRAAREPNGEGGREAVTAAEAAVLGLLQRRLAAKPRGMSGRRGTATQATYTSGRRA